MPASKKRSGRKTGRPLAPRTDTQRMDLLVKLVAFGRGRREVSIGWGGEERDGALELHAGPAGHFQKYLGEDAGGDLRALLDRVLSSKSYRRIPPAPKVRAR